MSYQVLARKWRPKGFADLVGQEHVARALQHALGSGRLHHAYLFTGTRGVGKTTLGRILARCLNCERGVSDTPCGVCDSCREIFDGRFVDLIEIDAASRTGIDDMRELLDNVPYAPTRGRFKVYLIDEVHMLSKASFNALLKTLEEPPEHVKFIFATTDAHKVPVTILSRCLQFNLKNMPPDRIVAHLKHVLASEHVTADDGALMQLARAADGSMRDALSLTDQAIAYGGGALCEADVSAMLGTIDRHKIEGLCRAVAAHDARQMLAVSASLAELSPDYASVLASLVEVWHRVAMEQAVPGIEDGEHAALVRELAAQLSKEDVQLFYQIGLIGRKDLAISPDPRAGFEMSLLRMLAFRPLPMDGLSADDAAPTAAPLTRTAEKPKAPESAPAPVVTVTPPAPVVAAPQVTPPSVAVASAAPMMNQSLPPEAAHLADVPPADYEYLDGGEDDGRTSADLDAKKKASPEPNVSPEPKISPESHVRPTAASPAVAPIAVPINAAPAEVAAAPVSTGSAVSDLGTRWCQEFAAIGLTAMAGNIASMGALHHGADGAYVLTLPGDYPDMLTDRHRSTLIEQLGQWLGQRVVLTVQGGDPGQNTPAAWREARRLERLAAATQALRDDPVVQELGRRFEAQLIERTIEPLTPDSAVQPVARTS